MADRESYLIKALKADNLTIGSFALAIGDFDKLKLRRDIASRIGVALDIAGITFAQVLDRD